MSDIVEQLRIATAIPICKPAADEIESLRQQLDELAATANKWASAYAEKDAEIERLKSENRDACVGLNDYFGQQLAASQLQNT